MKLHCQLPGSFNPNNGALQISIQAQGEKLRCLDGFCAADDLLWIPDPTNLFVEAVNFGFFSRTVGSPIESQAQVLASSRDIDVPARHWQISITGVDNACFRTLINIFKAIGTSSLALTCETGTQQQPDTWSYPGAINAFPLKIIRNDQLLWKNKRRSISIVSQQPLESPLLDMMLQGFEIWTTLLLLGGYAQAGQPPASSGGLPDGAHIADAYTVLQTFTEAFFADEAAFNGIINFAQFLRGHGHPVIAVEVG